METFSYSVAIRTLGTAGDKYEKLLKSIQNQTIQPEKIVVILPKGYEKPIFQLGNEEFVFTEKSMIIQRLEAINHIKSEYILFSDDDIEYSSDYIEKLSDALLNMNYDCVAGPLTEFFPLNSFKYKLASVLGGACAMLHGCDKNYVRILKTGGWSYNHNIKKHEHRIYNTESLPWTNFLIKSDVMKKIRFEDEIWSEKSGYSAFEDRIMFYKLVVNGYCVGVVSDASYIHNDARTSKKDLRCEPMYAGSFNHFVFWHRFLYSSSNNIFSKAWMKVCINYYILGSKIYSFVLLLVHRRTMEQNKVVLTGFKDAKRFVKTEEYRNLPDVFVNK